MTYEEIVLKVREGLESADAREIFEHLAVQANITGEGSGAFYIEIADRCICVEPYDYVDRDGLLTADAGTYIAISTGELSLEEAMKSGRLQVQGNMAKLALFSKIKLKKDEVVKEPEQPVKEAEEIVEEQIIAAQEVVEEQPAAMEETAAVEATDAQPAEETAAKEVAVTVEQPEAKPVAAKKPVYSSKNKKNRKKR